MSTYRKGLIGASISSAVLLALTGAAMAQQPLTKEEIERRKAQQQQKGVNTTPPLPPKGLVTQPGGTPPAKTVVTPPLTPQSGGTSIMTPPQGKTPTPIVPKGLTAPAIGPGSGSPVLATPRPIGTPPPLVAGARPVSVSPLVGPQKLDQLKAQRVQKTDAAGRTLFIEPGNRTLIKKDNRLIIHRDESKTLIALRPDARTMRLPNGVTQSIYIRPDGIRVYSEFDGAGRLIRRYGRRPGGPDIVYLDNRRFYRNVAIGIGVGVVGAGLLLALSPPVHALPPPKYIVDYDRASDDDLYEALTAPPVVRLERAYSLDEIRYSQPLRDRMRRIDIDAITFDTNSFEITQDQYGKLERMAKVIARAIEKNPAEMVLIEGHTDAVGSDDDNLTLSDRRAEAVARVLTEYYNIPMENLTTQGYGEQFLKVPTQEAERSNRRVSFRNIGPLLGQQGNGG